MSETQLEQWCKIFDTEEHGQVLIQKTSGEEGLAVKTTFNCDIGEVAISIQIKESDTDEESQHKLFMKTDKVGCVAYVSNIKKEMGL